LDRKDSKNVERYSIRKGLTMNKSEARGILIMILIFLLLLSACTLSKKTETEEENKVDNGVEQDANGVKEDENVHQELIGKDWVKMVQDEKLYSVKMQSFSSKVFTTDIITWLDDFFNDIENQDIPISKGVVLAIDFLESNQLNVLEYNPQFGGESFTDKFELTSIRAITEEENTVYVFWKSNNEIYLSVAEDGKWNIKDKLILDVKSSYDKTYNYLIVNKTLYLLQYNDDSKLVSVRQINFDEQGATTFDKEIFVVENGYYPSQIAPISTQDDRGIILYGSPFKISPIKKQPVEPIEYKIFMSKNPENPITFEDKYHLISYYTGFPYASYFANLETNKIYFSRSSYDGDFWTGVKQMDMTSGEPLYNQAGKDKETKVGGSLITNDKEGRMYIASADMTGYIDDRKKVRIGLYDKDLNLVSNEISLPYSDSPMVTVTDNELHYWRVYEFQRKTALDLVRVSKIK
jgi:hypothetical protein